MNNRMLWVDYAKAIGIILVVYGHVVAGVVNSGIPHPNKFFEISYSVVYSFHMPLFFFLSGLFFYPSFKKRGASGILSNKVDTILYPYILWFLIQAVFVYAFASYTNHGVVGYDLKNLLLSPPGHFWFLYALFSIFLLLSLIFKFLPEAAILPVFIASFLLYYFPIPIPDAPAFVYIARNMVFFTFGMVLVRYAGFSFLYKKSALLILLLLFIALQYYFHYEMELTYKDRGLFKSIMVFVSMMFIVALSCQLSVKPNKFWLHIGGASMIIYLAHVIFGSGFRVVLRKIMGVDDYYIHILLGTFAGLGFPLLMMVILQRFNIKYVYSAPVSALFGRFLKKPQPE